MPSRLAIDQAHCPQVGSPGVQSWENIALQAEFRPARMGSLCGVSLRTLQRHFTKNYGMTISVWLRSVRLAKAREKILAGDQIKAVAIDLGFKQLSHFSRAFKEHFGMAPSFLSHGGVGTRRLSPENLSQILVNADSTRN
jgi:AraC-like DNA-binding protein